jgi:hypothetical protein
VTRRQGTTALLAALAGALAALALLAGSTAPSARGAEAQLERLLVPGGGTPVQTATQLRQGATYRLVVTGYVFVHYGPPTVPSARTEAHDALYCWSVTGYLYPGELCLEQGPIPGGFTTSALQVGGAAGPLRNLTALAGRQLPYVPNAQDPTHRYEVSFVAATSGPLVLRPNTFTGASSYSGQFTVLLFGEPPPAPPVAPAPGSPCPGQTAAALGGATADQLCPEEPPTCAGEKATIAPDPADPIGTPIFGTPGRDVIVGSTADDLVFGRGGNDRICGLAGNDLLAGNAGGDDIYGGPGNDRLRGGDDGSRDDLFGEAGNDRHLGGPGNDRMDGGTGADIFIGGPGEDVVDYSNLPGPVEVDLSRARGPGRDVLAAVERVAGTKRGDRLFGDGGDNVLVGYAGGDVIHGRGGTDILQGGKGPDTLVDGVDSEERGAVTGGPNVDRCLVGNRLYVFSCELDSGDPLQPPDPDLA